MYMYTVHNHKNDTIQWNFNEGVRDYVSIGIYCIELFRMRRFRNSILDFVILFVHTKRDKLIN